MDAPLRAYLVEEIFVEREGRPLALRVGTEAGSCLLLHLQDLSRSRSVWALLPEGSVDVSGVHWDHWDDEGWHDVYESLPEDFSVPVVLVRSGELVGEAEVLPRPAEVEALLDAALDVFEA